MKQADLERLGEIPDPLALATEAGASGPGAALEARLRSLAAPTRDSVRRRRRLALALSIAWSGVLAALLGLRGDVESLPVATVVGWLALPFVMAAVALGTAVRSTETGLGVRVALAASVAVIAPMLLGALALALPMPQGGAGPVSLAKSIAVCLGMTLAGTAAPLTFALVALRNSFAAGAAWRRARVGGASGLLAGGSMNLHCPLVDPMHLLLGHVLPVAIAVVVGALVGRRWLCA